MRPPPDTAFDDGAGGVSNDPLFLCFEIRPDLSPDPPRPLLCRGRHVGSHIPVLLRLGIVARQDPLAQAAAEIVSAAQPPGRPNRVTGPKTALRWLAQRGCPTAAIGPVTKAKVDGQRQDHAASSGALETLPGQLTGCSRAVPDKVEEANTPSDTGLHLNFVEELRRPDQDGHRRSAGRRPARSPRSRRQARWTG